MVAPFLGEAACAAPARFSAGKGGLLMSLAISCPQCRAALKLPDGLPTDRVVACPNCNLKFVPTSTTAPSSAPANASGGTAIVIALMVLVLGAGVGVLIWNAVGDRDQNPPANTQASSDKAAPSIESSKAGPPSKAPA